MKNISFVLCMVVMLLLAACGSSLEGMEGGEVPTATIPAGETSGGETSGVAALPVGPMEITFQAADGQELNGRYYPAAVNPAPVVVLMHWMGGDMNDWNEVAPWLQNRGLENPYPNPGDEAWWDPTWFPPMAEGRSYGVLIFSFRGCRPMDELGCMEPDADGFLLDAQAAMMQATQLEGADPDKIVAIGSSIGADGAVDGCMFLNEQNPGACQGALSLSPGGYLTIIYKEAVRMLGENDPATTALCLADESESFICEDAIGAGNTAFEAYEIPGGQHGNRLMRPDLDPLPMQLILDFLLETVGQ